MNIESNKVFIAGAGPGDPALITLKALEKIKIADVIVYDRLINTDLLLYCKEGCEKIYVGKETGNHSVTQEKIIDILITKAKQDLIVVRLKGGDPFIFGRGSEEAIAIKKAGIQFEIIPGITSGVGASIYSSIPLTHRGLVTQCVFITAHESPDKNDTQIEWEKLAKMKNTSLIFYMGASKIEYIIQRLIKSGLDPSVPSAVIENATLPQQRTITACLSELSTKFKDERFNSPSIIIISPSVNLRDEICWFEKKPLLGKRIVITRARDQSKELYQILYGLGAEIMNLPMIKTELKIPQVTLNELFSKNNFKWILFTSENGVRYFFELLKRENLDTRILGNLKIGTIGSGTVNLLKSFGLNSDFLPKEFTSFSFIEDFKNKYYIQGTRFLRIKGDFQQDNLTDDLSSLGGIVKTFEIYRTLEDKPEPILIENLKKNGADIFTFTSSSIINNFFKIFGTEEATNILNNGKSFVIGPSAAETLLNKNIQNIFLSSKDTIYSLVENILIQVKR